MSRRRWAFPNYQFCQHQPPTIQIEHRVTPFASWFLAKELHLYRMGITAPGSAISGIGDMAIKAIYKVRSRIGGFHPVVTLKAWQSSNLHRACQSSESFHSPLTTSTRLAEQMWFESLIKAAWDTDSDFEFDQYDLDQYDETYLDFAASRDVIALTVSRDMEFLPTSPTSLPYGSVDRQVQLITGLWHPFIATNFGTKVDSKFEDDQGYSSTQSTTLCTPNSYPRRPHVISLPSLDTSQAGSNLSIPFSTVPTHASLELQKARRKLTQENHLRLEVGSESLKHNKAKDPETNELKTMIYATDDKKFELVTRMREYERIRFQFRWRMIPSVEPLTEGIVDPITL
ncbi:hypothetical protein DFH28DRAFT_1096978 [Melampsora americana]|nr:hypothetical protein DFH28DRAFT_1096978 [Melampsora americana]